MIQRTNHRILLDKRELEYAYDHIVNVNKLPPNMEIVNWRHVACYLTEEQFKAQDGKLFPECPVTGAIGIWDPDWDGLF